MNERGQVEKEKKNISIEKECGMETASVDGVWHASGFVSHWYENDGWPVIPVGGSKYSGQESGCLVMQCFVDLCHRVCFC